MGYPLDLMEYDGLIEELMTISPLIGLVLVVQRNTTKGGKPFYSALAIHKGQIFQFLPSMIFFEAR